MTLDVSQLEALVVGRDDRLVVRISDAFPVETLEQFRQAFVDVGLGDRVLIIHGDRDSMEFAKVAA